MTRHWTLLFVGVALTLLKQCVGEPTVEAPAGTFIGLDEVVIFGDKKLSVQEYLGIPYAEPPVGKLRFEKPVPKAPFSAPFRAVEYGPACLQMETLGMHGIGPKSEDCLSLNVFVPADADTKPVAGYPVMIWVHGGGFIIGESDMYHAATMSGVGNVIVVTINYRLGIFGFLSTGDSVLPGNYGLWDQHYAFQWVHANIRAFGGDTKKTTIFGESAGGISVAYQSFFAGNEGLFQGVIAESGTASMPHTCRANGIGPARHVAKKMGCKDAENIDSKGIKECAIALSFDEMRTVLNELYDDPETMHLIYLTPAFDNDFVKVHPKEFISDRSKATTAEAKFFSSLNFMAGANDMEGIMFLMVEDREAFAPSRDEMRSTLIPGFLKQKCPDGYPPELIELVLAEYTDWSDPEDPLLLRNQYVKLLGDNVFVMPTMEWVKKHSNLSGPGETFLYQFRVQPSAGSLIPSPSWAKGSNHGDEQGYVFGFDKTMLNNVLASLNKTFEPEDWEIKVAEGVIKLWTNFAKTWNPNKPEETVDQFSSTWFPYDDEKQRYLEIGREKTQSKQRLDPKGENFWSTVFPGLLEGLRRHGGAKEYQQDSCSADGSCPP